MNIKRIAISTAASAIMLGATVLPAFAKVPTVPGPISYGPWTLDAPATINFTCGGGLYVHTLDTVNDDGLGNLTGAGHYNPVPAYTWDMTGSISGSTLSMQILYTGIAAGSVYNLSNGVISADGSISGTVDSNCQTFTMPAGSATRTSTQFTGNHGQWVSSQEDRKEAAQSRTGMPVQSEGHTN